MDFVILIGIILAFVGVVWYLAHSFEAQREQEYAGAARMLGLQFSSAGDDVLLQSLEEFPLFQVGHGRKLRYLIQGRTQNVDVALFDYRYTTGGGNSSSSFRQTVVRFQSPLLNLPRFELRPAHVGHRLAKLFGYKDISFPEQPAFSKKYVLRGDNEEAIREVFTEEVLLHLGTLEGLHVTGDRAKLVIYRPNKRLRGHELHGFLEEAFGIYTRLKNANRSEVS